MSVREVGVGVRRRGPGWGERPSMCSGDVGGSVVLATTPVRALRLPSPGATSAAQVKATRARECDCTEPYYRVLWGNSPASLRLPAFRERLPFRALTRPPLASRRMLKPGRRLPLAVCKQFWGRAQGPDWSLVPSPACQHLPSSPDLPSVCAIQTVPLVCAIQPSQTPPVAHTPRRPWAPLPDWGRRSSLLPSLPSSTSTVPLHSSGPSF